LDEGGREEYVYNIPSPGNAGGSASGGISELPVTSISWRDIVVWCNAYSEMKEKEPVYYDAQGNVLRDSSLDSVDDAVMNLSKNGFRLPTEAEWEYAARGGDPNAAAFKYYYPGATVPEDTTFNLANASRAIYPYAWFSLNSGPAYTSSGTKNTWPVGNTDTFTITGTYAGTYTHSPNTAGLYDMAGNVTEMCWDWYDNYEIELVSVRNPTGPTSSTPLAGGLYRRARGGYYSQNWEALGSARRSSIATNNRTSFTTGFRVVLNASATDSGAVTY
jgi:formylglycine-generating enzyme required for sulfatase activity